MKPMGHKMSPIVTRRDVCLPPRRQANDGSTYRTEHTISLNRTGMIWPTPHVEGTMFCMMQTAISSVLLLAALCTPVHPREMEAGSRIPILNAIDELLSTAASRGSSAAAINPDEAALTIRDGIRVHAVETPYQSGRQEIHVLLPDSYRKDKSYRVVYVLPVEKGFEQRYGYGLGVLKAMNAHNKYDLIIVQMGFEKEPWYGDHATDPKTRQAGYLKEFVVPFIEKRYSTVGAPAGRLLLGFSKSGWGAFSLILRYPEFFGYAASWDAPMFFDTFHYRMESVYGTLEQLNAYRPDLLVSRHREYFQKGRRLVLMGERDWGTSIPAPQGGSHTVEMHELLVHNGIRHVYDDTLNTPHRWSASWMAPTLEALLTLAKDE
jgi:hypothetical protein